MGRKASAQHVSPAGRIALSFVISTMLLCPFVAAQEMPSAADSSNSTKSAGLAARQNFTARKRRMEFTPPPWPPVDVDAGAPANSEASCPEAKVLKGASQHAADFSANLDRFTATETIQSADASGNASWGHLQTRTYNYMALVTHPRAGVAYVDESRVASADSTPPSVRTEGLAVTALIFDPQHINEFAMTCEGAGEWHGKPSWTVHFAQKEGIPVDFQVIHADDKRFGVKLKGRAWIAADDFEIEHMDVDLLQQIPEIRLLTEHLSIEYGAVGFTNGSSHLWLPQQADFYLDLGGRHYYNHNELSNFLLFSVGLNQEIKEPKLPKESRR